MKGEARGGEAERGAGGGELAKVLGDKDTLELLLKSGLQCQQLLRQAFASLWVTYLIPKESSPAAAADKEGARYDQG